MFLEYVPILVGIVIIIMLASRVQKRGRDSQGKFLGLLIVILGIGIIIIYSAYNGLLNRQYKQYGIVDNERKPIKTDTSKPDLTYPSARNDNLVGKPDVPSKSNAKPSLPNVKPSEPNGKSSEPNGKSSEPNGKSSEPNGKPSLPNVKPSEPNGTPSLPNVKPSEPNGIPSDKKVNSSANDSDIFYGIMFDAGSTGSRIHVFKFQKAGEGKPDKFIEELFLLNKNGLSTFAENPSGGAESLRNMLEEAKKFIPANQWGSTPIALKATAGLRLLPGTKASALLEEVKNLFSKYPFQQKKGNVGIMEGNDEGVFSWVTVNFLNGFLGDIEKMIGVLDLGGGSTQVTFTPTKKETVAASPKDHLIQEDLFGKKFHLYTHSYLGSGLLAGRLASLGEDDLDHESDDEDGPKQISTPCMAKGLTFSMKYGSKTYNIQGKDISMASRFDECYNHTMKAVNAANISKIEEIKNIPFYAISYYYDKAEDAQLLNGKTNGEVKVGEFYSAAKEECNSSGTGTKKPLLCLDLCYITALLQNGFGFEKDNHMIIKKKIGNTEISWALGAMFDLTNQQEPHGHGRR